MKTIALPLLLTLMLNAAPKPLYPPGVKPVGPYTPGLDAGEFVYVSGQGARDAKGQLPATPEEQVRQTLENVKAVLEVAGLTMEHVVYTQAYLSDMKNYDVMNKVWSQYFPKNPPARSTIGVTRMPTETPVEIAAVAVRDLKARRVVRYPGRTMPVPVSPAIALKDRVYITGGLGRVFETGAVPKDPAAQMKLAMDYAGTVLKSAGMELRHLVYANIYVTPQMPKDALAKAIEEYIPDETAWTVIETASLPFGVNIEISGVASRSAKRMGACSGIGDTVYCGGRSGTINAALDALKADLSANGLSLGQAVASNVYVDDLDQFAAMNKIYATYFGANPPTRTTVQPGKKGAGVPAQVSVVVIR